MTLARKRYTVAVYSMTENDIRSLLYRRLDDMREKTFNYTSAELLEDITGLHEMKLKLKELEDLEATEEGEHTKDDSAKD